MIFFQQTIGDFNLVTNFDLESSWINSNIEYSKKYTLPKLVEEDFFIQINEMTPKGQKGFIYTHETIFATGTR
jgi:hypothetical protein